MGCTHSRSEDLYKKSIINSETFIGSISETPGYFSRTAHTLDFVESKFPNPSRTEMSYNGPPSHLQNSMDVHPFWGEFGREFHSTDRYNDMSNGSIPRGLLPGTDTAQEMRNLELKESLKDLRSQVKAKMEHSRPIPEEEREDCNENKDEGIDEADSHIALNPPESSEKPADITASPKKPLDNLAASPIKSAARKENVEISAFGSFQDEKAALDLLDSVISESMDFGHFDDEEDVSMHPSTLEDQNWSLASESFMKAELRRRNKDLPGVMHEVAPVGTRNSMYSDNDQVANGGKNVLRSSMYLPEANFTSSHNMAALASTQQPVISYRLEATNGPSSPLGKSHTHQEHHAQAPFGSLISSNSTDTGIFSDGGTTNSASSNDSGLGSGGHGVTDLVRIYNEQSKAALTTDKAWKRQSANLDNLGKAHGAAMAPAPHERRHSQPDDLPADESIQVPRNSAILNEIRAELQRQLSQ